MSEDPVPYGVGQRPDAFFLAHLGQRMVVAVDAAFPRFPEINAHGTHAIGLLYTDHEKGIALRIESFLVLSSDAFPRITRKVFEEDGRHFILLHQDTPEPKTYNKPPFLIARAAHFPALAIRPATEAERHALRLDQEPLNLDSFNRPEYVALRQLSWLDPYRAPWYPDDIQFELHTGKPTTSPGAASAGELIWGRTERLHDDMLIECAVLNQPHFTQRVQKGDRALIAPVEQHGKLRLLFESVAPRPSSN